MKQRKLVLSKSVRPGYCDYCWFNGSVACPADNESDFYCLNKDTGVSQIWVLKQVKE